MKALKASALPGASLHAQPGNQPVSSCQSRVLKEEASSSKRDTPRHTSQIPACLPGLAWALPACPRRQSLLAQLSTRTVADRGGSWTTIVHSKPVAPPPPPRCAFPSALPKLFLPAIRFLGNAERTLGNCNGRENFPRICPLLARDKGGAAPTPDTRKEPRQGVSGAAILRSEGGGRQQPFKAPAPSLSVAWPPGARTG